MPVSEATYRKLAEEDFESGWELVCGELRRKPGMTMAHNTIARIVTHLIQPQLALDDYEVAPNQARLRLPAGNHYVPDVVVIPTSVKPAHKDETGVETYPEPMPLIVEVWSPSTGSYDVETKLRDYQERGDAEIWRIDARDRSITSWVRQSDGSYAERRYTRGAIRLAGLPGVTLDVAELFRRAGV